MSAWAIIVGHIESDEWLDLCAAALTEVQRETRATVARVLRASKVSNPLDEIEEHVNNVLDDLANRIEEGRPT